MIANEPMLAIRWLIRRDMPEVLAIEEECYGPFAWAEEDFTRCMRQRNCIGMVIERDERIAGFMIYLLEHKRLELLNISVHPMFRREGCGTAMIAKLVGKLAPQRRESITVNVVERNLPAQLFFKAMGFRAKQIVDDAFDNGESAYRFELKYTAL